MKIRSINDQIDQSKKLKRLNRSRDEEINRFSAEEIEQLKQIVDLLAKAAE